MARLEARVSVPRQIVFASDTCVIPGQRWQEVPRVNAMVVPVQVKQDIAIADAVGGEEMTDLKWEMKKNYFLSSLLKRERTESL